MRRLKFLFAFALLAGLAVSIVLIVLARGSLPPDATKNELISESGGNLVLAQNPLPAGETKNELMSEDGSGPTEKDKKFQEIFEQYKIVHVENVPVGVTPISINSPEELEALISSIRNGKRADVSDRFTTNDLPFSNKVLSPGANVTASEPQYVTVNRQCTSNAGLATFNTWAAILVGVYNSSYRWIDSANSWVGLEGVTLGLTLSDTYTYNNIAPTGTSINVTGGGIINVWLLINGMIQLYSTPVSCSISYSVY